MSDKKLIESRFVTGPTDSLATDDVYEVTENKIRSRATGISDELLSELLGMLRIPFEPIAEIAEEILDLIKDLIDALMDRIKDFLSGLPSSVSGLLEDLFGKDFDILEGDFLGFANLGLIWEYAGELVEINPEYENTYDAVRDYLDSDRRSKPGYDRIDKAVDQGAETIVIGKLVEKVIQADIAPPLDEILDSCSSDEVRDNICETVFPNIFDPKQDGGFNPKRPDANDEEDGGDGSGSLGGNNSSGGIGGGSGGGTSGGGNTSGGVGGGNGSSGGIGGNGNGGVSGGGGGTNNPNDTVVSGDEGSDTSVTQRPSPFYPIDWEGRPDKDYEDLLDPDSDIGDSVGGNNNQELPPGIRDNLPSWVTGTDSNVPGFNWDIVDTIKDRVNPDSIMNRYPRLPGMILHYYAYPGKSPNYEEEYDQLISLLDWLDADWARINRKDLQIGKLKHFRRASNDAIDLLSRLDESLFREEVMIGRHYNRNRIPALLRVQYPQAAL